MERAPIPSLTDGVIQLRPLTQADAAAHLAGEDEEMGEMAQWWTQHGCHGADRHRQV